MEVEDALLPRNAGRFVLTVEGGRARVVPGGAGSVRVRARALGPWYAGHSTAESLAFAGLLSGSAADLAAMTALTAGSPPAMADFF